MSRKASEDLERLVEKTLPSESVDPIENEKEKGHCTKKKEVVGHKKKNSSENEKVKQM